MSRTTWVLGLVLLAFVVSAGWALFSRSTEPPLPRLRIEVLNGCGEEGLAASTAQRLRDLGQDVVKVADADRHDYDRCVIIDRGGRPWLSRRLARRLGGITVILEREATADVDVTLILGKDHGRYLPPPSGPSPGV